MQLLARFKETLKRFRDLPFRPIHRDLDVIRRRIHTIAVIEQERYVRELLADPKYNDPRSLLRHGFKTYSQNEEDGIIEEIFRRIGTTSRTFVEFGVDDGLENNSLKLLLEGWRGLWLEGSPDNVDTIRQKFADVIADGRLVVNHAFIDRDNINGIIGRTFTGEIDLISIDIDGNDIYVMEALEVVNPRVIIIEYNGKFRPPISIAQAYDPGFIWAKRDYTGASLAAIEKVAAEKGYSLVGCNIMGINAFLVRNDLVGDLFHAPFTAEHHHQPARNFLWPTFVAGHDPDWGRWVRID